LSLVGERRKCKTQRRLAINSNLEFVTVISRVRYSNPEFVVIFKDAVRQKWPIPSLHFPRCKPTIRGVG